PDLSWREACAVLHEEVDRLPDRYPLPLLLCYLQGQSRDEAARGLGWARGTGERPPESGRRLLPRPPLRRRRPPAAGLVAATAGTSAKAVGVSKELAERTARAAAGGGSRSARALAREVFPGVVAGQRAVASVLLLTMLLGVGVAWNAAAGGRQAGEDK